MLDEDLSALNWRRLFLIREKPMGNLSLLEIALCECDGDLIAGLHPIARRQANGNGKSIPDMDGPTR